jgi:KDO2-lipid IV(A) lauroyltransferase
MSDLPGFLAYRTMAGLFGLLPEPVMRRSGQLLGTALSYFSRRKFALLRSHQRRVVGPVPDLDRRVRRMYASYGRYWAEVFWVRPRRRDAISAHASVEGIEHISAAQAAGRGIILALPHVGNWEAAGAKAVDIGIPVLAVAEALPNQRLVEWFMSVRSQLGIEIVLAGKGRSVSAKLLRCLKSGGTIALLADRDLSGNGIEVDFFGERTTIPSGPVALADRTGAALLPVGCYFKRGRGHTFIVSPPITLPDIDSRPERLAAGAQQLAAALEAVISVAPEQWHLFQPNWPSDRDEPTPT